MDTAKLSILSQRIREGTATNQEKDEYMWMLFQFGHITAKQYEDYRNEKNKTDLLNTGLTIGAIVLFGMLLKKLAE